MIPQIVVQETEKVKAKYLYGPDNALYSVDPCETMFGYTYFSNLIPPFKPHHTLILGYGAGTVANLMRKIWGDCKITGVDIETSNHKVIEYRQKVMDAKKFLWDATTPAFKDYIFVKDKYDYVCIDLWNGLEVCPFVFDVEFAVRLREIATGLVSMNVLMTDVPKMMVYNDYGYVFDRTVPIEKNSVLWWSIYNK